LDCVIEFSLGFVGLVAFYHGVSEGIRLSGLSPGCTGPLRGD